MELEATQSQLHGAIALLEAAEIQRVALQASQDKISALIHPIRRAPDDVLKMIFELTVERLSPTSPRLRLKVKQALTLASVCGRWRAIALETPRLWNEVYLSFRRTLKLEYNRQIMLPRTKNMACEVTISGIFRTTAPAFFRECGIANLPFIKFLSLIFVSREDIEPVLNLDIFLTCNIRPLQIGMPTEQPDPLPTNWEIDVPRLVLGVPSLGELRIVNIPGLAFRSASSTSRITTLILDSVQGVMLPELLRAFPSLEHLEIGFSSLRMDNPPSTFAASSLRSLELLQNAGKSWMTHINFPNLEGLVWKGEFDDELLPFLSTHRTITKLTCLDGENVIPAIESMAPQVRELSIDLPVTPLFQSTGADSSISFSSLQSLSVFVSDADHTSFGIEEFDSFIRARCLPARHPKCLVKDPSHIIPNVSFILESDKAQKWHESELFKASTRSLSFNEVYSRKTIHLSWPNWS